MLREALVLDRTRSIFDPIEKNSLALFKRQKPKLKSKQAKAVALFLRLYVVAN